MVVKIITLPAGHVGYSAKRFPGSKWDPAEYLKREGPGTKDWAGLYYAPEESTAEGYVPDYADSDGNGVAYVNTVSLVQKQPALFSPDPSFKTGSVDMAKLKQAIRDLGIDVQNNQPLMPRLGVLGYAFSNYANEEDDIEVIYPNVLVANIKMVDYKKCKIKNYVATCT